MANNRRHISHKAGSKRTAPNPHDHLFHLKRDSDEEYFVMIARHRLMAPMTLLYACLAEKDYPAAQAQFATCLAEAMLSPPVEEAEIVYTVETAERGRVWHEKNIVHSGGEVAGDDDGEGGQDEGGTTPETDDTPTVVFPD